jgi:arginyl-tRNA synthetase
MCVYVCTCMSHSIYLRDTIGLLAVGYELYGSEEELNRDPIKHLFDVYVKINADAEKDPLVHDKARAYFKRMEQGDTDVLGLWRRFRDLSIVKYREIYARLNVDFDVYSGESFYSEQMKEVIQLLEEKELLREDRGAKIIDLKPYKLTPAVIIKSDGTTLYITRDIAAAIDRQRTYKFDKLCYVTGAGQGVHFTQLFKILELMDFDWHRQCEHVSFGMVKGMRTRTGEVVFLEDILNEAKRCMHEVMQRNQEKYSQVEDPESVSDIVGLSAVLIQDMQARRIKDYEFDWTRITSFEGDTGPYLQFTHARLASIERRQGIAVRGDADVSLLIEEVVFEVCEKLARFPEILTSAMDSLEPCTLVNYLFSLCHSLSTAFDQLWVRGAELKTAEARMLFYWASRMVLHRSLQILGLTPLERM